MRKTEPRPEPEKPALRRAVFTRKADEFSDAQLAAIYAADNAGGDCDCVHCREYRRRRAEQG